ncbi:DUF2785 domain-containing protein [Sporolactobacillus shoreicorticis]|uniref:DUF2785 domain-containing protein n=1 Tax=Sporolactobacillus shoreicorticis TaxID=1923877 RepID=A0ABW5S970_9BACL|nr:DUF2785 domain-containing protein [Sporolactobacillus shoreicorticis]MCO7128270.1 DUF2785 domain-containing protein [Sporolactobacillus shoreicorticis]
MTDTELKKKLLEIKNNDFHVPEESTDFEAAEYVMHAFHSTDSGLRDDLGYTILSKWLIEFKMLHGSELMTLLTQAASEKMLFYKVGEGLSDHVFLRSFSALLVALILYRDNQEHFIGKQDYMKLLDQLNHYCELENDYRSFVAGKGWAHAPAHISDALDECAQNRFVGESECLTIWESLLGMLRNASTVFDAEEDERMATAVVSMVTAKKITVSELLRWFCEVDLKEPNQLVHTLAFRKYLIQRVNTKHFMRCVYFRLKNAALLDQEADNALINVEHAFNPYF